MDKKIIVVVKGIIEKDNKILLIKRSENDPIGPSTWEFVGGKIEFHETMEEALNREVYEETSIKIKIIKLLYVTSFFTSEDRKIVLITYLCKAENDNVILSSEHNEYGWFSYDEIFDYLPNDIKEDIIKYKVIKNIHLTNAST